jgi:phage tail-like protein
MAETGKRIEPYGATHFLIEIGGVSYGIFRECTGFGSEVAVLENPQGGNLVTQKLPGRVTYPNIVLRWGLTDDEQLYNWHRTVLEGGIERRDGSIVALNRSGAEVARWNFFSAWPSKWDGPAFNATTDELAIESLELTHEGIVRA